MPVPDQISALLGIQLSMQKLVSQLDRLAVSTSVASAAMVKVGDFPQLLTQAHFAINAITEMPHLQPLPEWQKLVKADVPDEKGGDVTSPLRGPGGASSSTLPGWMPSPKLPPPLPSSGVGSQASTGMRRARS